ncbi:MAG: hypothetical protein LBR53_09440 [Deltaproteobacteria bacterium]|nr:hypothetical protein [Deltaproteobacteria bacterium]
MRKFSDTIVNVSLNFNKGQNFHILIGNFLEVFYTFADQEEKSYMMRDAPVDMTRVELVPFLAAAAHKLANDYKLPVPPWVFEKRCYLPGDKPYFSTGSKKGPLSMWFLFMSPSEFKHRNLFVDENVLMRV